MYFTIKLRLIINPTTTQNSAVFIPLIKGIGYINHYEAIELMDTKSNKPYDVVLTHPVFQFNKPDRISGKNNTIKPAETFIAVYDPKPLGKGSFGCVYPVIGVWKLTQGLWVFKTKSDPSKQRVVKTNHNYITPSSPTDIMEAYVDEQQIGRWVNHMGYKYPPVNYGNSAFLLMRKQPGRSLEEIIKELRKNPNALSIIERLKITVNALTDYYHQVQSVQVPLHFNQFTGIVHQDIKPGNILVDTDCSVRYIDYGLAKPNTVNNKQGAFIGTLIYLDPLIFSNSKTKADHVSDFASLARTLAELWGDQSADILQTHAELKRRNFKTQFYKLLYDITTLTEDDQSVISNTLRTMNAFYESDRITREKSIPIFQQLLTARLNQEQKQLLELINTTPLDKLSQDELLAVLSNPTHFERLPSFRKNPSLQQFILTHLTSNLGSMDDTVLYALRNHGLDFSQINLLDCLEKNQLMDANKVRLLIKLDAQATQSTLESWVLNVSEHGQKYRWASVCRAIYQALPHVQPVPITPENCSSFKAVYLVNFLTNPLAITDDKTIIRLIKQGKKVGEQHNSIIMYTRRILESSFPGTPFATAMLNDPLLHDDVFDLSLVERPHFKLIHLALDEFTYWIKQVNDLIPIENMPHRNKLVRELQQEKERLLTLADKDWKMALSSRRNGLCLLGSFMNVEGAYWQLKKASPAVFLIPLLALFEEYFSEPSNHCQIHFNQTTRLTLCFVMINQIELIKNTIVFKNNPFPENTLIEQQMNALFIQSDLKDDATLQKNIIPYKTLFVGIQDLFKQINTLKQTARTNILLDIHSLFLEILPSLTTDTAMSFVEKIKVVCHQERSLNLNPIEEDVQTVMRSLLEINTLLAQEKYKLEYAPQNLGFFSSSPPKKNKLFLDDLNENTNRDSP